mmetsp:Transcript_12484/g.31455  ORF Transcript_12484/g.31455 Transcript_12484/m.31455 type:complete len:239 (-) Transcript_12484:1071-1787(-)
MVVPSACMVSFAAARSPSTALFASATPSSSLIRARSPSRAASHSPLASSKAALVSECAEVSSRYNARMDTRSPSTARRRRWHSVKSSMSFLKRATWWSMRRTWSFDSSFSWLSIIFTLNSCAFCASFSFCVRSSDLARSRAAWRTLFFSVSSSRCRRVAPSLSCPISAVRASFMAFSAAASSIAVPARKRRSSCSFCTTAPCPRACSRSSTASSCRTWFSACTSSTAAFASSSAASSS